VKLDSISLHVLAKDGTVGCKQCFVKLILNGAFDGGKLEPSQQLKVTHRKAKFLEGETNAALKRGKWMPCDSKISLV
jgi:hypothetical protein